MLLALPLRCTLEVLPDIVHPLSKNGETSW